VNNDWRTAARAIVDGWGHLNVDQMDKLIVALEDALATPPAAMTVEELETWFSEQRIEYTDRENRDETIEHFLAAHLHPLTAPRPDVDREAVDALISLRNSDSPGWLENIIRELEYHRDAIIAPIGGKP